MCRSDIHTNRYTFPNGTIETVKTSMFPKEGEIYKGFKITEVVGHYNSQNDEAIVNIKLGT